MDYDAENKYNIFNVGLTNARSVEVANLYLEKRAKINKATGPRHTNCLGNAVVDENLPLIDFLLDNGANLKVTAIVGNKSLSPITYLLDKLEKNSCVVIKILKKFRPYLQPNNTILLDILEPELNQEILTKMVSIILKSSKIDIDLQDNFGMTALMIASDQLLYNIVALLINYSAKVLLVDDQNFTAIDYAELSLDLEDPTSEDYSINLEIRDNILQLLQKAAEEEKIGRRIRRFIRKRPTNDR